MKTPSSLSDDARAECLGPLPKSGLQALADKHGLNLASLASFRHRVRAKSRPAPIRPYRARLLERVDLPRPGFGVGGPDRFDNRWVIARKAAVLRAVSAGQIPLSQAMADYGLSFDEFLSWAHAFQAVGERGLRVRKGLAEVRHGTRYTGEG